MKIQFKNNVLAEPVKGQQVISPDGLANILNIETHGSGSSNIVVRLYNGIERWYSSTNIEYLSIPGRADHE